MIKIETGKVAFIGSGESMQKPWQIVSKNESETSINVTQDVANNATQNATNNEPSKVDNLTPKMDDSTTTNAPQTPTTTPSRSPDIEALKTVGENLKTVGEQMSQKLYSGASTLDQFMRKVIKGDKGEEKPVNPAHLKRPKVKLDHSRYG